MLNTHDNVPALKSYYFYKKLKKYLKLVGVIGVCRSFLMKIREIQAKVKPIRYCERGGVKFKVDLNELIDWSIYHFGWEPETIEFLYKNVRSDDVVIEVGANVGAHTLIISKIVGKNGRVFAFEPTLFAREKLLKNIELNSGFSSNIEVENYLVTNQDMAVTNREIKSSWRMDATQRFREVVDSPSISLDDFAKKTELKKLSLLKIDVDGYDYKVLCGAVDMIKRFSPVIFMELCEYALKEQGDSLQELFALMNSLGYKSFYEDGTKSLSVKDAEAATLDSSINGVFRRCEYSPLD